MKSGPLSNTERMLIQNLILSESGRITTEELAQNLDRSPKIVEQYLTSLQDSLVKLLKVPVAPEEPAVEAAVEVVVEPAVTVPAKKEIDISKQGYLNATVHGKKGVVIATPAATERGDAFGEAERANVRSRTSKGNIYKIKEDVIE